MKTRIILLVRHPEAKKNLEDRHGGPGTPLSDHGKKQCTAIAEHIRRHYGSLKCKALVGHTIPQVKETVEFLSRFLGIEPVWNEKLQGINLGVIAGLSRAEANHRWPHEAKKIELWRGGQIRIDEMNIQDAEPIEDFKCRINNILLEWINRRDMDLLMAVCTRSVLIMLTNLVAMIDGFDYGNYRPFNFKAGSITELNILNSVPKISLLDCTEHLVENDA